MMILTQISILNIKLYDRSGSGNESDVNVDFEYSDDETDIKTDRLTKHNKFAELDEILDLYASKLCSSSVVS